MYGAKLNRLLFLSLLFLTACSSPVEAPAATRAHSTAATNTVEPSHTQTDEPSATWTPTQNPQTIVTRAPSSTPVPTEILRTATPTRLPSPRIRKQSFDPPSVLAVLTIGQGDGGPLFYIPDNLILYGNGQLILKRDPLLRRKLPRKEICRLLYTIEQTGYFDIEPSMFDYFGDGGQITILYVGGWDRNTLFHDYIPDLIFEDHPLYQGNQEYFPNPYIPAGLLETFLLFNDFHPEGMQYYEPQYHFFSVEPWFNTFDSIEWPVKSHPISDLIRSKSNEYGQTLRIISRDELPGDIDTLNTGAYFEGDNFYYVQSRPAWPYEVIDESGHLVDLGPPASELTEPIECFVSDGVLPIPTLSP